MKVNKEIMTRIERREKEKAKIRIFREKKGFKPERILKETSIILIIDRTMDIADICKAIIEIICYSLSIISED